MRGDRSRPQATRAGRLPFRHCRHCAAASIAVQAAPLIRARAPAAAPPAARPAAAAALRPPRCSRSPRPAPASPCARIRPRPARRRRPCGPPRPPAARPSPAAATADESRRARHDAQGIGAHGLSTPAAPRRAGARTPRALRAWRAKPPSSRKRASVICSIRLPDRPVLRRASAKLAPAPGHDRIADAQGIEQGLVEAAAVDDAVGAVQALQGRQRRAVVVELAVIVVLHDPDAGLRGQSSSSRRRDTGMVMPVGDWCAGVTWTSFTPRRQRPPARQSPGHRWAAARCSRVYGR